MLFSWLLWLLFYGFRLSIAVNTQNLLGVLEVLVLEEFNDYVKGLAPSQAVTTNTFESGYFTHLFSSEGVGFQFVSLRLGVCVPTGKSGSILVSCANDRVEFASFSNGNCTADKVLTFMRIGDYDTCSSTVVVPYTPDDMAFVIKRSDCSDNPAVMIGYLESYCHAIESLDTSFFFVYDELNVYVFRDIYCVEAHHEERFLIDQCNDNDENNVNSVHDGLWGTKSVVPIQLSSRSDLKDDDLMLIEFELEYTLQHVESFVENFNVIRQKYLTDFIQSALGNEMYFASKSIEFQSIRPAAAVLDNNSIDDDRPKDIVSMIISLTPTLRYFKDNDDFYKYVCTNIYFKAMTRKFIQEKVFVDQGDFPYIITQVAVVNRMK